MRKFFLLPMGSLFIICIISFYFRDYYYLITQLIQDIYFCFNLHLSYYSPFLELEDIFIYSSSLSGFAFKPASPTYQNSDPDMDPPGTLKGNVKLPYTTMNEVYKAASNPKENTENMFLLAKEFAKSGREPTADIINKIQKRVGGNRVTPEQVALFKDAYENHVKEVPVPLGRKGTIIITDLGEVDGGVLGCYIAVKKDDNQQGVGSSKNLLNRLRSHLKPSRVDTRISQFFTKYGRTNFKLYVVKLPSELPQTESALLAFEQYLFLLLNPSINNLFIAGSHVLSDELNKEKANNPSKNTFIYYNDILVAKRDSIAAAIKMLGASETNNRRAVKKGHYYDFKLTTTPILDAPEKLMSDRELLKLANTYKGPNMYHLYIGGEYVDSYENIKGVIRVTGFTYDQVNHSVHKRNGLYHKRCDIVFSREIIENAPVRIMTDNEIKLYCEEAKKFASRRSAVFVYQDGLLVNKFLNPLDAFKANRNIKLNFRNFKSVLNNEGSYVVGKLTYTNQIINQ